jgi:NADH:ubiquinone oxidoreductase subunit 4 (subunit M)
MLLSLILVPLLGIFTIYALSEGEKKNTVRVLGLFTSILNFVISLVIFILFDFSSNQFQFVQESYEVVGYNVYLGIDGLSIYFIILTTIIMPISIISN